MGPPETKTYQEAKIIKIMCYWCRIRATEEKRELTIKHFLMNKSSTVKILKNYRITLWLHLNLGKDFLNKKENIQSMKEKTDKFDSIFLRFSMTKYAIKKFKDNQQNLVIVHSYR